MCAQTLAAMFLFNIGESSCEGGIVAARPGSQENAAVPAGRAYNGAMRSLSHRKDATPGHQLPLRLDQADDRFRIRASSRLETLAERLAEEMRRKPADALEPERVVVPDALLGQWLRLELASRLGVAAHLRIEQPAQFAWAAMREVLPELAQESVFGPSHLRWRIFDRLGDWTGDDEIGRYLADGDARKRFELAHRLAVAYDRCRIYRPDSIREWQQGASDSWHARLWADLAADEIRPRHWVDAIDRYRDALARRAPAAPRGTSRPRVSFFHVAAMSPTYVEMLKLGAGAMDVDLYMLSPSLTFWDDPPASDDRGYYEEHDDLLGAWGRPSRDLQALLVDGPQAPSVLDRPTAEDVPGPATCLAALQRDVLNAAAGSEAPRQGPQRSDDSIQIHVCHSATREVEVLHDRLLGIFDAHPDIQPADVLILTPDLDTYAPLIEAVFGAAEQIPFSIGRRRLKEGAALAAFLDLLELPGARYPASEVLAPLLAAPVRARFRLDDADLTAIRDAVARARIRWGIDGDHRTELGVPASANHNWRHGLSRLVLGYAMDEGDVLIDGKTPCALDGRGFRTSAHDYELLGRFCRYCELAFALDGWMEAEHTASQWTERLRSEILDAFFARDHRAGAQSTREIDTVARLIDEFEDQCRRAEATEPIPFPVLRDVLNGLAAEAVRSAPRLADGVAVAGLASGQVLPAKVICAVGLNDGLFPGRPRFAAFDFQADLFDGPARRPGDRDRRDEDRFAFLETLLAARRCLVLTYTGRDLQEDKPIPASVVVSELIHRLTVRFPAVEADDWTRLHPLQPFSPRYFQDEDVAPRNASALFSYSQPMAAAATTLASRSAAPDRFQGEVAETGRRSAAEELELEDLVRFAFSPSKDFIRNRLDLVLGTREDRVEDDEALDLNALEVWRLKTDLADFGGLKNERTLALAAARGLLPPANLGRVQHRESAAQVRSLLKAMQRFQEHEEARLQEVDTIVRGVRLSGGVARFHDAKDELLWWRIGRIRPKDRLAVWLRLLAAICHRGRPAAAYLFGVTTEVKSEKLDGPSPDAARSMLGKWVEVWRDGQRRPLPFFPSTSWKWVGSKESREAALKDWNGDFGEGGDACHRLIFGDDPLRDPFESLASDLLRPLQEASS